MLGMAARLPNSRSDWTLLAETGKVWLCGLGDVQ